MIPNRCMFVFLEPMQFSLVSYLAIRSAAAVNRPDELVLYYERMPSGPWWEAAREYVTHAIKVDPPRSVGTVPLQHPAHRADVLRLQRLLRDGGIYLDLDVLCVRPFTPLLDQSFVLGQEGTDGPQTLCNAVILAEPGAEFTREWLRGFDPTTSRWGGFRSRGRDEHWNEFSGKYPAYLASILPNLLSIAPYDAFYWPMWSKDHLDRLFMGQHDEFPNAYCHHLWQSYAWEPYLRHLTPDYIRQVDTNFNLLARPYFDDPGLGRHVGYGQPHADFVSVDRR